MVEELSVSEVSVVESSVVDGWVLLVLVKLPVMVAAVVITLVELPVPIMVVVELYPLAWMVVDMCTTTLLLLVMVTDILGIEDITGLQILSASVRDRGGSVYVHSTAAGLKEEKKKRGED